MVETLTISMLSYIRMTCEWFISSQKQLIGSLII